MVDPDPQYCLLVPNSWLRGVCRAFAGHPCLGRGDQRQNRQGVGALDLCRLWLSGMGNVWIS
jgi:hypothetical protein